MSKDRGGTVYNFEANQEAAIESDVREWFKSQVVRPLYDGLAKSHGLSQVVINEEQLVKNFTMAFFAHSSDQQHIINRKRNTIDLIMRNELAQKHLWRNVTRGHYESQEIVWREFMKVLKQSFGSLPVVGDAQVIKVDFVNKKML